MTLSPEELVFRSRALAQAHPFSALAQSYLQATVTHQRLEQPVQEIGIWAGHALTVGYCLRRVEETDSPAATKPPVDVPMDLDEMATDIAERIRTDRANGLLLYPEPVVVDALDDLIAGEVERRLSDWADSVDEEAFSQLESYIAWWVVKGYALRVAERLLDEKAEEGSRQ